MQETAKWKQLNNIPESSVYIEFPLAFTGKSTNGKATAFTGLPLSAQFILAGIHTFNKISGAPAKLTYEHFIKLFGMSKETVCAGINLLIKLGIIIRVKQARYKIKVKYNKKDYIKIDTYLLKHVWEVDGIKKRIARSRIITLAFLNRGVTNPETKGVFISSQSRISKAINLPKSTAGDSIRELYSLNAINYEKQNGNDKQRRGCSLFTVNPQIMAVKHPYLSMQDFTSIFTLSADELHARLMLDPEYSGLIERININYAATVKEIKQAHGENSETQIKLDAEAASLRMQLDNYFKVHKIKRDVFPPGYFRTDIIENEAI